MLHFRQPYAIVAVAAALPRLAVVLTERGDILAAFTEKNDEIARTFVDAGTFGFIPGEPTASTQPLYGFFLAGVYSLFGRSWGSVGLTQAAVATATALVVTAIGRRMLPAGGGLLAGLAVALHPYLVWHDVHVNREVLDGVVAAALVLAVLATAERRSLGLAAVTGALAGVAVLGNARLALLPLVVALFLAWWNRGATRAAVVLLVAAAVVAPWVIRNDVVIGCPTVTTDSRALWKANNVATYETLARGGWIDDVPDPPGARITPEDAGKVWRWFGVVLPVDECAQMGFYRELVVQFWREQPEMKARLAAQAAGMLWDPRGTRTEEGPGADGFLDLARRWLLPLYLLPLYVLAVFGFRWAPRRLSLFGATLLVYVTGTALVFAGATRYRAPWDFLLALLAAGALVDLSRRYRARAAR